MSAFFSFETEPTEPRQATQPPEDIPDFAVQGMLTRIQVNHRLGVRRQVSLAMFDLEVHSATSIEEVDLMDISTLYRHIVHGGLRISPPDDEDRGLRELMGDYAGAYYYKVYSNVGAQQLLRPAVPVTDDRWRQFRRHVVEMGASQRFLVHRLLDQASTKQVFYDENKIWR